MPNKSTPIIKTNIFTAMGGVIFVAEVITKRLLYSSLLILGGILLVVLGRYYFEEKKFGA